MGCFQKFDALVNECQAPHSVHLGVRLRKRFVAAALLALVFSSCVGRVPDEPGPTSPFVDGLSIRPYPSGKERQEVVFRSNLMDVRLSPSARPLRADFYLDVRNLRTSSVWLDSGSFAFRIDRDLVANKYRCVTLTEDHVELGITTSREEIRPSLTRHFLVTASWEDISSPRTQTVAALEWTIVSSTGEVLPHSTRFLLGPSPYSRAKSSTDWPH
jgi:hypothetical protein